MTSATEAQAQHDLDKAVDHLRIIRIRRSYGMANEVDERYAKDARDRARKALEEVRGA
ncbi:hypothetical protein [Isoptericola sp. NPDC056134]|uniref:hypothetical protein n=1 Tax=Isoptericola sp. NPDC056134 TaxID=3345723 RepID=UPI0035ED2A0B